MKLCLNSANQQRRDRAVLKDLLSCESASLAKLWCSLTTSEERILDAFFTSDRCYLILESASRATRLSQRQQLILERVLRGECQKAAAIELGLGPSTVAVDAREALNLIGMDCKPSRCHPLPMAAAMAAVDSAGRWSATSSVIEEGRPLRVVSISRPETAFAAELPNAEVDILRCLVEGLCHREIAQHRRTSVRTIANQIASVSRRFHVSGRNELVCYLLAALEPSSRSIARAGEGRESARRPPSEVHAPIPIPVGSHQFA